MHKLFLPDSECSYIKGADEIIKLLGGFPSMENCKIVNISITCLEYGKYNVELSYDISELKKILRYFDKEKDLKIDTNNRIIKLKFSNCVDVICHSTGNNASDIYFANIDLSEQNGKHYGAKDLPSDDDIPFLHDAHQSCVFYDRYESIKIYFFADQATVSAFINKD